MTCDKVVLIIVQQYLSDQSVLLHPHRLARSSLIEQMLLQSNGKTHLMPRDGGGLAFKALICCARWAC